MTQGMKLQPEASQETGSGGVIAEKQLLTFLRQMQFRLNILDDTRREMNVYLARDFNAFKYIAPDENLISDIFADFLNPEGPHGQGVLFLGEFLKIINPATDQEILIGDKVSVIREQATDAIPNSQRRIDIVIKFEPSQFWLGIENKPWATDQSEQLSDYSDYLRNKSQDNFLLIYMSGSGAEPSRESIEPQKLSQLKNKNRFVTLCYRNDLSDWLRSCKQKCEAERIRFFLQDFTDYIERTFSLYYDTEEVPTT
ncbi:MAG: PD-(D/E)XK nuclease family protein [Desulfomonilaceae bacterium]